MDESGRLDDLLERLRHMGAGDRKAILQRLSLEQRFALDAQLAAKPQPEAPPPEAPPTVDNQIFSTMLAKMLDRIEEGGEVTGGNGAPLTDATRTALREAARIIREERRRAKPDNGSTLKALVQSLFLPERGRG